ncbi:2-oxoglutarate-dependent dioxygenase htyE-like [Daphnia pulex]|uniref:2-oxoglutarate-dependent dioxygenase htyE-like n=1 Tax=Daphnia pulex TaxID=6669 RepID=UPI001EE11490|nr:2-oxoglutarate-dependent dioxygenase htyE-like [Daphnia pulex]
MASIPIVDLTALVRENDISNAHLIVKQLDEAFSTVGFVYLTNHGIDQTIIDKVLKASKHFFLLPDDIKKQTCRDYSKNNDGYVGINQEILGTDIHHEIKEAYNLTSSKSVFPSEDTNPEFRSSVTDLALKLSELTRRLLACMALALGLTENYFVDRHRFMFQDQDKNATTFRTLYYPSLSESDIQPGIVRCGAHSDYGTITLLLQDSVGGLEVLSGSKWIPATPIPGSILVNLGDLMQFWTSDRYTATVHRVLVPEEELRRKSTRQSIAFFVHPDNDVMVSQLNGSSDQPAIGALDYLKSRLSATYKY